MKKLLSIPVILLLIFCKSDYPISQSIQGNWQIMSNTTVDSILYTEIYIDSTSVHIFMDPVGVVPSSQYYIQNDSLYLKPFSSDSFLNIGRITFAKNQLKISNLKGILKYRKIKDGLTLEDLIKKKNNENGLGPIFYQRMEKWTQEISKINY